ncbi:serine/threonine-protein kinase [Chondromyces crocatus]|uniref:serine/threonine-protein kinase n=1 Tax=Chondromyces crocatus TaxID=52 RepID=UPI00067B6595|nr:serine/threonine-protein kinase [Chondromyces crocatus]
MSLSSGPPKLDKYELIEEIGHGGMATVYRARDPRLGREVAVKVIHKHLRDNTEVAARFLAEARAAAKLRHQGIVEVYDVATEDDGERYLVAELLRGCTLRKLLQKHPELPAEVGAAIVLELCSALEHAHACGIIHRDVKPENVLVELPEDRASPPERSNASGPPVVLIKLTDFGIAKILDTQGLTSTGQVLGSPAHMAPEQIEGGEVDARTDAFALGVLMYECLVGHLPFEGKNPAQVLRRVLEGAYPPADQERPSVGGRWSRVVASALAREPADRIAGPGALAESIRGEFESLGIVDPRAELVDYFTDPEGYVAAHVERLVPRLVTRAESARRNGDVQGAAADLNRALALAPDDLTILKKISSLTSTQSRRQLARRMALLLIGSATLGVASYGVARHFRTRSPLIARSAPWPAANASGGARSASSNELRPTIPAPSSRPDGSAHTRRLRPPLIPLPLPSGVPPEPSAGAAAHPNQRKVHIAVIPGGARMKLDGKDFRWFGRDPKWLDVGVHHAQVSVPNSKCCKPFDGPLTVTAADESAGAQSIVIKLEFLPATVSLAGAPANAQYTCPSIGLSGFAGGAPQSVVLPDVTWIGSCLFTPPTQDAVPSQVKVTLRSGEANTISWPSN